MKIKAPIVIVGFSILIALFLAYVSFLPKVVVVKSKLEIKATQEELLNYLSQTNSWKDWFFIVPDSSRRFLQIGHKGGVEAGIKWFSKLEGDGALQLKFLSKDSISYDMITDNNQFREKGKMYFKSMDSLTTITWLDSLDVSTSLFSRIAAKNESFASRMEVNNLMILQNLAKQFNNAKNRGAN